MFYSFNLRRKSWKLLPMAVLVLICTPKDGARSAIVEDTKYGPACSNATQACKLHVRVTGQITNADFDELNRLVNRTRDDAKNKGWEIDPPFLYLDSRGGSVSAAIAVGKVLRQQQAYVQIEPDANCYSACVLVLAGAVGRYMQGRVGIHRPYFEVPKGEITPEKFREMFDQMLQQVRGYFREMNVAEQLADAMLRIEPENVRILDREELIRFGLTPEDPAWREMRELKAAQNLGLDRAEYNRRKALAIRSCSGPATFCAQAIMKTGRVDPTISPTQDDPSQYGRPFR